jgi:DNA-binding NarL/FixJ family response regulator
MLKDAFEQACSQKPAPDLAKLTAREQEVLALLAQGCLYKEIASKLSISINTLRSHLRAIYDKLRVHSRTEATVKYLTQNLFIPRQPSTLTGAGMANFSPIG